MRPCTLAMFWLACCIYLLKETVVQCLDWPWSTGSCSHLHPTCAGSDQSTKPSGTIAPCTSWSSFSPFSSNFYWPSYIPLALEAWVAGNVYFEITFVYVCDHPFTFNKMWHISTTPNTNRKYWSLFKMIQQSNMVTLSSLAKKENLFSVREFETETSNFAPNGCLRVSINWKFDARSNGMLRMIPRPL